MKFKNKKYFYDIELHELYNYFNTLSNSSKDKSLSAIAENKRQELLADYILPNCKQHNLNFDNPGYIVVDSRQPVYRFYFGVRLAVETIPKIYSLLDYHLKQAKDSKNFANVIEFKIYPIIEFWSVIKTDERSLRIMDWVRAVRLRPYQGEILYDQNKMRLLDNLLYPQWISKPGILSKNLSNYWSNKTITKINWTQAQNSLLYLFYRLNKNARDLPYGSITKLISKLFTFNGISQSQSNLSKSLSKLIKLYGGVTLDIQKPASFVEIDKMLAELQK